MTCEVFLSEEIVYCKIKQEIRFNPFRREIESPKRVKVTNVHCDLNENSGVTYNHIGKNISELYDFHDEETIAKKIAIKSELYKNYINSRVTNISIPQEFLELSFKNTEWQLLLNGFDYKFPRVNSLNITDSGIVVMDKKNLKQFDKYLITANFKNNMLMSIPRDLFHYNSNLRYCDFSDNPLSNIPFDPYLNYGLHASHGISFDFKNVECVEIMSRPYLYLKSEPVDCNNLASVIHYDDLEYHLTKESVEASLICSVQSLCSCDDKMSDNNELDFNCTVKSGIYNCNMTIDISKTYVSKSKFKTKIENKEKENNDESMFGQTINLLKDEKTLDSGSKNSNESIRRVERICSKPLNALNRVSLAFYNNHIIYIPAYIVITIDHAIHSLDIINSGLVTINEFDMKQFGKDLTLVNFALNALQVIGKNTFRHNINLQSVRLDRNPLIYVDSHHLIGSSVNFELKVIIHSCGKSES